ncbi:MAG: hybrid histidine kinase/response regulator HrmK [Nostocales cyanobacterium 94392]|nr:hybrid histidine kinase/response regulator HrmK [Nostocales cyanobacterium 94392]
MQQYSSLPEQNSQLDADSSTVLTTIEQLRVELWLERSLNQLQNRLNNCQSLALTKDKQEIITAEIFQTVVTELAIAINSSIVAIALEGRVPKAIIEPQQSAYKICYISSDSTTSIPASSLAVTLNKSQQNKLTLNSEIKLPQLQQLEEAQTAWCLNNDILGTVGWLIISGKSSIDSCSSVGVSEQIPKLMEKAAQMCMVALTQVKQIESLQQQAQQLNNGNQELQRTNQLKNQFLANTSHEIRTPLSSIIGFTHLLLAQGYDPNRQRHHEYLNIIQSSGKHLLALINDILDLSKIEANQLEVNWENIDVPQLCRNVLALIKEKAANKGLQMRLEIDDNVTNIVADPLRLKQILLNLLFNAVKFTKTGTVGLEVKPHNGQNEFIRFTVWDTGIGISEEHQSELFQPYFQVFNDKDASSQEGTGLGLTVTRKLVEIHGGSVEVKSVVGKGSYFTVMLPVTQNQVAQVSDTVKECQTQKTRSKKPHRITYTREKSSNILLVEDDIPNAQLIKTFLERLQYQVTWVKTAAEMWDALKQQDYFLILMDIVLPDANGLALVKQLRENPEYSHIPIVAQTAMAMKGDRDTCMTAGVNDYISKPIDLALLEKIVSQYIETIVG